MDKSLRNIGKSTKKFLWSHHFTLFLVLAAGGVALGIYSLLGVINHSTAAQGDTPSGATIIFDDATMKKVYELQSSDQQQTFSLPATQRTDPFLEK